MCSGVYYSFNGEEMRFYFQNPKALLPVKMQSGGTRLFIWGRRTEQHGNLPLGGWARLDGIYAGRWDRWFPIPVKVPVSSFMEKDLEGHNRWYDLTKGQWIQGLIARHQHEQRIYVVTVEPELSDAIHDRWPRIMSG